MKKGISIGLVLMMMTAMLLTFAGCGGSKAPTSIGLTSEAQMLGAVGDECNLSEMLIIEEGADTAVTYISSDESVAKVSEDGLVTAAGYGVATITITSAADESVAASIDVAVYDFTGVYAGEKYIDAMSCNIEMEITLKEDGTFDYYRAPMNVAIQGGGQMPELEDGGTYAFEGTKILFSSELLGEYSANISIENGTCLLKGNLPTGGAGTDMVLTQNK